MILYRARGWALRDPYGSPLLWDVLRFRFLSQLLASASYDDTVKLYHEEEDDWVCCATLEGHESTVWSVAFDGSGERLASCSDDKTVRIWQCYRPGNEEGELPPRPLGVAFPPLCPAEVLRFSSPSFRGGVQRHRPHLEMRLQPLRVPHQDHLRRGVVSVQQQGHLLALCLALWVTFHAVPPLQVPPHRSVGHGLR